MLLTNGLIHFKASGHICGIVGPALILLDNGLWAALPIMAILLCLAGVASIKTGRHTLPQMIGGGAIPVMVYLLLRSIL